MAFMITSKCSGKETICEDICAYNCIKVVDAAAADCGQRFKIDEEQCTDCCACALACPESAIAHDDAYRGFVAPVYEPSSHRVPMPVSAGEWEVYEGTRARNSSASIEEVPEGYLRLNGKIESWARLMATSSD